MLVALLFTTAALIAVVFFEWRVEATGVDATALLPYVAYVIATVILAWTFAPWFEPGSDRWVAYTLVPAALVGAAALIASVCYVAADVTMSGEEIAQPSGVRATIAIFSLPGVIFVMISWPALLCGYGAAAVLSWRCMHSRGMRSNKSLERAEERRP